MGHSSGAMGVSLLTMLPQTKGLFAQAIFMSGEESVKQQSVV
jgi:carboxylesterase type B